MCEWMKADNLGLAPVRSSKQDQIHASLVSTLLALMDGMDGRGEFTFTPSY
jgi:SpoVK/Ycf46/Vps4 family AAA+-type ATPase